MKITVDTQFGMQAIEVRFAIKSPSGAFFTEMKVGGLRDVIANGAVIAQEQQYLPQFDAAQGRFATQFDTQADGELVMANPQFGGPDSFQGCSVVPSE